MLDPHTGSVFAKPVKVLLRSLGKNKPAKVRRNPARWVRVAQRSSEGLRIHFEQSWDRGNG